MARKPSKPRRKKGPPLLKYSDAVIIEALKRTKASVYMAAEALGCDPGTIYDRFEASPAVKAVLECERGKITDVAEMVIYQNMIGDDKRLAESAAEYHLSRKARDRGYGDKLDLSHSGPGGSPLPAAVNIYLPDNGRSKPDESSDDGSGTGEGEAPPDPGDAG